jgi:hypothetical protein
LLCRLTSILPSFLERKVSFERMVEFKGNLLAVRQGAAQAFHARVPGMPVQAFEQVMKHTSCPSWRVCDTTSSRTLRMPC